MEAIDKRQLRAPEKTVETGEEKPDIDLAELSTGKLLGTRERLAERAKGAKQELQQGSAAVRETAQKAAINIEPQDAAVLQKVDQQAEVAEHELLARLDAAKRRMEDARKALDKASGLFSGLTKGRREARSEAQQAFLEAETAYNEQVSAMSGTKRGKNALDLLTAREQLVDAERGKGSKGKLAAEAFLQKRNAREMYEKKRAEIIGDHIGAVLQEQAALADARALETAQNELGIYKLNKALSNANLGALLGREGTNRVSKMLYKGINMRTAVNLALVGGGVLIAGSGAGFAVSAATGGVFLARKLIGGGAATAGAYDLLRTRRSAKLEQAIGKKISTEELGSFNDKELGEALAQLESQAILNGVRVSDNGTYQQLAKERARRMMEKRESSTEKGDAVKKALAEMMRDTDEAFTRVYEKEKQADVKLRYISVGIGAFVASGAVSEILKGAWHVTEAVADATGVTEAGARVARAALDTILPSAIAAELSNSVQLTLQFEGVAQNIQESPTGEWTSNGMQFHMTPDGHIEATIGTKQFDLGTHDEPNQVNWGRVLGYAEDHPATPAAPIEPGVVGPQVAEGPVAGPEPASVVEARVAGVEAAAEHAAPSPEMSEIMNSHTDIGERAALLKAYIQEHGQPSSDGRLVVETPDHNVSLILKPDGTLQYAEWNNGVMVGDGIQPLASAEDWAHVDHPIALQDAAELPTGPEDGMEDGVPVRIESVDPEPAAEPTPDAVEAPVEIPVGAHIVKFLDAGQSVESRADALHHVMDKMGHGEGQKTFSVGTWNVRLYESADGRLSYTMKGPDGSDISERLPLNTPDEWQTMTEHMHTDVSPDTAPRATGLFVDEADRAARMETEGHFPTPNEMAEGAVKGIRTADAHLDRSLDGGAHWLDTHTGGNNIDQARQDELMRRLGIPQERIDMVHDRVKVEHHDEIADPGKQAEFRAEQAAAEAAKDKAALDAAAAQHEALASPADINPAAHAASLAELQTGKVTLPAGGEVTFTPKGNGFVIEVKNIVGREEAIRKLLGPDYRQIVSTPGIVPQDHAIQIRFVEDHAQQLAADMEVRDYMINNGLTDRPEYAALLKDIAQEKADVSRFGHVIVDDPKYGAPSTAQTVGRFVSWHPGETYNNQPAFRPAVEPEYPAGQKAPVYVEDAPHRPEVPATTEPAPTPEPAADGIPRLDSELPTRTDFFSDPSSTAERHWNEIMARIQSGDGEYTFHNGHAYHVDPNTHAIIHDYGTKDHMLE